MSGVLHDFECLAHGHFEARVKPGSVPKCPKGCSASLVKLVHLRAPGMVSARTRKGDRLVREMAEMQGLSDISTSPSRPGGSVAARNAAKVRGPKGREYPAAVAAGRGGIGTVTLGKDFINLFPKDNPLTDTGFGHKYDSAEWKKDDKTGQVRHIGAQGPIAPVPTGSTGVSVERVKE